MEKIHHGISSGTQPHAFDSYSNLEKHFNYPTPHYVPVDRSKLTSWYVTQKTELEEDWQSCSERNRAKHAAVLPHQIMKLPAYQLQTRLHSPSVVHPTRRTRDPLASV